MRWPIRSNARQVTSCTLETVSYTHLAIIDTLNRNLKGQMKYANKLKAGYSVVIGDDEIEHGVVTLKDMKSGEQKQINSKEDVYKRQD